MSKLSHHAQNKEQREAIVKLEAWATRADIRIRFGTSVGKHPQGLIFEHERNDNLFYISRDGTIKDWDEREVEDFQDFQRAVREMYKDAVMGDNAPEVVLRMRIGVKDADGLAAKVQRLIDHGTVKEAFGDAGLPIQSASVEVAE